jgi:thymidylate synthase
MFCQTYNANTFLLQALQLLKERGEEIETRGTKSREVCGVSFRISNPRGRIITLKDRKFPVKGALAEFLWYMTKNPKIEVITPFLKHWANYSDDGETVNSNYGFCAKNQIDHIIEKIRKDRSSRQGVINLYNQDFSQYYGKDTVCTPNFQILIRDERLNMIVNARSRDIIRGECIDQFTFTLLQEIIANELGCDVGWYQVNIGSLHIYEEHYDMLDMSSMTDQDMIYNNNISTKCSYTKFWTNINYIINNNIEDFIGDLMLIKEMDIEHFNKYVVMLKK